ncbi:uncharacterized protein LOC110981217 [Acanthaster planci]|uniref:Uncharacterized protein LOC110981217 n=1 Tax=Acanthaster planci TaxID=133434 RepID=A0A8B7YNN9_ACAPL|nr:uncharacterized protein LOC110981217 [Acanthaster planci]XP_022094276.1 uncharacterized protein LOC110981217 [Acanthaster planci]XP_022094277.1 uncharacterized protein LOC110981217 [Acanthaster planci]XP_022094278.1 uncharacterized protein LOC110981217 [Acanthaster planci]XP_022094279.1 uncharacterized protein LOC110981217 [Acanthaster planci]XP_022094280.1 uncharacterized protein LOC110981217 [Acanthaster planci]XP_022094281.1 uncharacterized protein LOC110981217 [Acanthaster planci]XP_0
MTSLRVTNLYAHSLSTFVVFICINAPSVTPATPAMLELPGIPQQPLHTQGSSSRKSQEHADGLDSFQTGMIIGFVTFAVLALCMMLLILYVLVRGTRRELRKARVELAELREQRRQDAAAERLQLKGRASELRCIVDEDDSSDLVKEENERDDGVGYDYQPPPSPSAYDNYSYVAMEAQRNSRHGRKKRKANDCIIEN